MDFFSELSAGIRVARFGGSTIARECVCLETKTKAANGGVSPVTWTASLVTVTLQNAHGLLDGAKVFIASPDSDKGETMFNFGSITRVDDFTFTMPMSVPTPLPFTAPGASTYAYQVVIQNRFTSMSTYRELNAILGGTLRLVGNLSTGSNNTNLLEPRKALIAQLNPHIVSGSFGIGNLVPDNPTETSIAPAIASITSLASYFTDRDICVVLEFPMGVEDLLPSINAAQTAWLGRVMAGVQAYAANNKRALIVNPIGWSINPATGDPYHNLFREGDGIHPNQLACQLYATQIAKSLGTVLPQVSVPPYINETTFASTNPIVGIQNSLLDNYQSTTLSNNLFSGGWTNADQINAVTLNAKATGECMPQFGIIRVQGNSSLRRADGSVNLPMHRT